MAERQIEQDFPAGHPGRADYNPDSPEAREYLRRFVHPMGERDFPVDHPGALDTPGNLNQVSWAAGVDPRNPDREAHTGRTPAQAAGVRALTEIATKAAKESPVTQPLDAFVVAKAMNDERRRLHRDVLTAEEHAAVLARLHKQPRPQGE